MPSTKSQDESSITSSSEEEGQIFDDLSEHSSEYSDDPLNSQPIKSRAVNYAKFKKRGNNNFPLKNLK
jgi:hypothetical protein